MPTLLGLHDGVYKLRASRPGTDVTSTTLKTEEIAFDSSWPEALNIVMMGYTDITGAAGQTIVTFPDRLFIPMFVCQRAQLVESFTFITIADVHVSRTKLTNRESLSGITRYFYIIFDRSFVG